jgi:hypothetical protein
LAFGPEEVDHKTWVQNEWPSIRDLYDITIKKVTMLRKNNAINAENSAESSEQTSGDSLDEANYRSLFGSEETKSGDSISRTADSSLSEERERKNLGSINSKSQKY